MNILTSAILFVLVITPIVGKAGGNGLSIYQRDVFVVDDPSGNFFNLDGSKFTLGDPKQISPYFTIGARARANAGADGKAMFLYFDVMLEDSFRNLTTSKKDFIRWHHQMSFEGYHFVSGGRSLGEIIPLFGIPYRISDVKVYSQSNHKNVVAKLEKVTEPTLIHQLSTDPFAHVIMNGETLYGVHENRVKVLFDQDTAGYVLETQLVRIVLDNEEKLTYSQRIQKVRAELGTIVNSSDGVNIFSYEVVKIVRPEPSESIPGWIGIRRRWPEIVPFGVTNSSE